MAEGFSDELDGYWWLGILFSALASLAASSGNHLVRRVHRRNLRLMANARLEAERAAATAADAGQGTEGGGVAAVAGDGRLPVDRQASSDALRRSNGPEFRGSGGLADGGGFGVIPATGRSGSAQATRTAAGDGANTAAAAAAAAAAAEGGAGRESHGSADEGFASDPAPVDYDAEIKEPNNCKNPSWVVGMLLVSFVSTTCDLAAFAFAPQSLLAPMAGLTLIFNILMAPFTLKEHVSRADVGATAIALVGIFCVAVFGPHESHNYDVDVLLDLYTRTPFVVYGLIYGGVLVAVIVGARLERYALANKVSWAVLAGAIGGTTGVFAKSVVELSKNGIAGGASWQHPATYAIIVALLVTSISQLMVLNRSLARFDAMMFVPIYQSLLITLSTITGLIYFEDFNTMSFTNGFLFMLGVVLTLIGVGIISRRPADDVDDHTTVSGGGEGGDKESPGRVDGEWSESDPSAESQYYSRSRSSSYGALAAGISLPMAGLAQQRDVWAAPDGAQHPAASPGADGPAFGAQSRPGLPRSSSSGDIWSSMSSE